MKYNVFTDFHHASLLQSFILLFEKRLGGNVYRPIGMDWATKGFWKVYDHPATQAQYLDIGGATPDGTPPLNQLEKVGFVEKWPIYQCRDIDSSTVNKGITFDAFMEMPIDIVIASLPQHIEPFKKLCQLHPNKPKFIYQIGNAWNVPEGGVVQNVMASAQLSQDAGQLNIIQYHQEFDLDVFKPPSHDWETHNFEQAKYVSCQCSYHRPLSNIYSFVNCFGVSDYLKPDFQIFQDVEVAMGMRSDAPWTFKAFGGQCRDGAANGSQELAQKMREARFIWHTKAGGDGYGHVLFNSAAVGRPLITKKSYYAGKLGEELMIDGETCINIDGLSIDAIVDKIVYYSKPDEYIRMCRSVYNNFKKVVDFDKEAVAIQEFLNRLV